MPGDKVTLSDIFVFQQDQFKTLNEKLDRMGERVTALEHFKYKLLGIAAVLNVGILLFWDSVKRKIGL